MKTNKLKMVNWKNGNGELFGFAICAPFLLVILIALMSFARYAIENEQLTAATYCVGRAAVVSHNLSTGQSRAKGVLDRIYDFHAVSGPSSGSNDVWMEMSIKNEDDWKVGEIITITLTQHFDSLYPLPAINIKRSIAMMIENQELKVVF